MTLSGLLVFAAAYLLAAASPGPGIAALTARVLARGSRGTPAFIAGFVVGDLIWFTLAATGLSLLAQTFAVVFEVVRYLGAAFLLYLAYRFWTAPPARPASESAPRETESVRQLFLGGLAITLGNPKVMVFFVALLPSVVDLERLEPTGFVAIAAVICLGLPSVLATYAITAARVRRLFRRPRAQRLVNRGVGAVMAGAAVAVATR